MGEVRRIVAFASFSALAARASWTAQELAAEFRGVIETGHEPIEHWFGRVLRGNPSGEVVIPFRSVIAKYVRAVRHLNRRRPDSRLRLRLRLTRLRARSAGVAGMQKGGRSGPNRPRSGGAASPSIKNPFPAI